MVEELENHKNCCRVCLASSRQYFPLTDDVATSFLVLTQLELIQSEAYSNLICIKCWEKLKEFSELQLLIVDNQTRLYQFVGRDVKSVREDSVIVKVEFLNLKVSNIAMTQYEESSEISRQLPINSQENENYSKSSAGTGENPPPKNKSRAVSTARNQSTPSDQQSDQIASRLRFPRRAKQVASQESLPKVSSESDQPRVQHFGNKFKCDLCNKLFASIFGLKRHSETHSRQTHVKDLGSHICFRHRPMLECDFCGKKDKKFEMRVHIMRLHAKFPQRYECDLCGVVTKRESIQRHMKIHTNSLKPTKLTECAICGKMHVVPKVHLDTHVNIDHPCECGKIFRSARRLKAHQNQVHTNVVIKCKYCQKVYYKRTSLQVHVKAQHKPKVPCEICGKLISQGMSLRNHSDSHGPLKYKCSVKGCTKKYRTRGSLVGHTIYFHAPEKKSKCTKCKATFSNKVRLQQHVLVQHREKDVTCQVDGCDYKAVRRDYMRKHYRCHKNIDETTRENLLEKLKMLKVRK